MGRSDGYLLVEHSFSDSNLESERRVVDTTLNLT